MEKETKEIVYDAEYSKPLEYYAYVETRKRIYRAKTIDDVMWLWRDHSDFSPVLNVGTYGL